MKRNMETSINNVQCPHCNKIIGEKSLRKDILCEHCGKSLKTIIYKIEKAKFIKEEKDAMYFLLMDEIKIEKVN